MENGLVSWFNSIAGGALTTLIGAVAGRLMWHTGEVRGGRRRFFGPELLWEAPVAVGMAIVGEGVSSYFELTQPASTALIAILAYLGPRGAEAMLSRWLAKGGGK